MCDPWDLRITSCSIIHGPTCIFLYLQTIPSPWHFPTLNSGFCLFLPAWRLSLAVEAGLGAHRYSLEGRGEQVKLPPGINVNHWAGGLVGKCCTDHVHLVTSGDPQGDPGASRPSANPHRLFLLVHSPHFLPCASWDHLPKIYLHSSLCLCDCFWEQPNYDAE